MNRRDLLKLMPVMVVPATVKPFSLDRELLVGAEAVRGFKIWSSGWLRPYNIHCFVFHWIAENPNPNKMSVYSCYPGTTDKCYQGQMLNMAQCEPQQLPGPWNTEKELANFREDAWIRLIEYIDAHYVELTK